MSSGSDDDVPPPVYERRRRGAVAVASDAALTSKQHDDVRQAIFVSLGPKRSRPLLKMFAAVKTVTMAQKFLGTYESDLGLLGSIQAATTLSASLAMQTDDNRMKGTEVMGDDGEGDAPGPTEEPEEGKAAAAATAAAAAAAAAAEAENAKAARKEERARRRAQQLAEAKRRAARKALNPKSRAMLTAKEKELSLAQHRLRELDRRLGSLADEEADILRQLESSKLTAEEQAALRYRLDKLRIEKQRLTSQRAKVCRRIGNLQADIEAILAGDMDHLAAGGVDEREQADGKCGSRNAPDLHSQRNPYAGTRFDPGKCQERVGVSGLASGLAWDNPLQCPAPAPELKRRPGSAMLVERTPSAEDRLDKYRQLLASEAQVRHAELQHSQPSTVVLRAIKATRRWQRIARVLKRRHGLRGLGYDSCLCLPDDDLGQTVSEGTISAARNVWCGTLRTHPFFEPPKRMHLKTQAPTGGGRSFSTVVPAAVSYALRHQMQSQYHLGGVCCEALPGEGKRKHEPTPPVNERPHNEPTMDFDMDVWHTIEHQIKCEKEERRLRMEERCRANIRTDLFQTGGTAKRGTGARGMGTGARPGSSNVRPAWQPVPAQYDRCRLRSPWESDARNRGKVGKGIVLV